MVGRLAISGLGSKWKKICGIATSVAPALSFSGLDEIQIKAVYFDANETKLGHAVREWASKRCKGGNSPELATRRDPLSGQGPITCQA